MRVRICADGKRWLRAHYWGTGYGVSVVADRSIIIRNPKIVNCGQLDSVGERA
jgi:hypothetical protein